MRTPDRRAAARRGEPQAAEPLLARDVVDTRPDEDVVDNPPRQRPAGGDTGGRRHDSRPGERTAAQLGVSRAIRRSPPRLLRSVAGAPEAPPRFPGAASEPQARRRDHRARCATAAWPTRAQPGPAGGREEHAAGDDRPVTYRSGKPPGQHQRFNRKRRSPPALGGHRP
jgi:hypothetical protein